MSGKEEVKGKKDKLRVRLEMQLKDVSVSCLCAFMEFLGSLVALSVRLFPCLCMCFAAGETRMPETSSS